jgi:hypothetical protein
MQSLTHLQHRNLHAPLTVVVIDPDAPIHNFFYFTKSSLTLIPKHQFILVSCSPIMQIHKNFHGQEVIVFEGRNAANHYQFVPRQPFPGFFPGVTQRLALFEIQYLLRF